MNKNDNNQQVTNVVESGSSSTSSFNVQVGTPEAVCVPTNSKNKKVSSTQKHQRWCEWLAGLIDGDGCFLVSKKGYPSLEITVESRDEAILRQIQNKYGGSLKPRAGMNAVRYRLHYFEGIVKLSKDVNGLIRHPVRMEQFEKICSKIHLLMKQSDVLHSKHGWFAGIFDADGSIRLKTGPDFPQITLSVTQKFKEIPEHFSQVFGGSLYYDKTKNGYFTWAVQSKENVLIMVEYFKQFPCRTVRRQKLFLTPKVYDLVSIKAHLGPSSCIHNPILFKKWTKMVETWQNLSFIYFF